MKAVRTRFRRGYLLRGAGLCMIAASLFYSCRKNACSSNLPVPRINAGGSTVFCSGGSVQLSVSGVSASEYDFQWQQNGNPVSGATGETYAATASGEYQVRITEKSCTFSKWSAPLKVTVSGDLSAVITAPDTSLCEGGAVMYANTCEEYTYQWKHNGEYIEGASGSTYTATQPGKYQLQVTRNGENAWSAIVNVTECK
jgi:hypothetical protein